MDGSPRTRRKSRSTSRKRQANSTGDTDNRVTTNNSQTNNALENQLQFIRMVTAALPVITQTVVTILQKSGIIPDTTSVTSVPPNNSTANINVDQSLDRNVHSSEVINVNGSLETYC